MSIENQKVSLLLVEDSQTDALLFQEYVTEVEYVHVELDHVASLTEALQTVEKKTFDAIVLDLSLPDSMGLDGYDKMRDRAPAIPIVILTGNEDRTMLAQALERGADNYLLKNSSDGNRIIVAVLSAMRTHSLGIRAFEKPSFDSLS